MFAEKVMFESNISAFNDSGASIRCEHTIR